MGRVGSPIMGLSSCGSASSFNLIIILSDSQLAIDDVVTVSDVAWLVGGQSGFRIISRNNYHCKRHPVGDGKFFSINRRRAKSISVEVGPLDTIWSNNDTRLRNREIIGHWRGHLMAIILATKRLREVLDELL